MSEDTPNTEYKRPVNRVTSRSRKVKADTTEMESPKPDDILLSNAKPQDLGEIIEPVADPTTFDEKAKALAFNEEELEIMIHESTNPNDEPRVFVCVNGQMTHPKYGNHLPRGVPISVKRKVVERLARAKPMSFATVETVNQQGERDTKLQRHQAQKYPFSVIHDPNPEGLSWLRRIMAERV